MKNEKVCPKCTSSEILRLPGIVHFRGAGNNIHRGSIFNENGFGVLVTRYVCAICGFSEEWIDDKQDVEKIKKWCDGLKTKAELDGLEKDDKNFSDTPPWENNNLI